MPAPRESQRVPKWHIPNPLYSLPSTRHFTTGPAADHGYQGAWTGFHVIEDLAPHPPGFRYDKTTRAEAAGDGVQRLTSPSRVDRNRPPPQCSPSKDSPPAQVPARRRVHFAATENVTKNAVEAPQRVSLPRTASAPAILTPSKINVPATHKSPLTRVSSTTSYSSTSTKVMNPQRACPQKFTNNPVHPASEETKTTTTPEIPILLHPLLHPVSHLRYDFLLSVDHPQQIQNLLHSAQFPKRPLPFNAPAFPHHTSITKVTLSIEKTSWRISVTPAANQFYITIEAVVGAAQTFLSRPIAEATWNAASAEARRVADASCVQRGGNVRRRIDWLGGKTKFGGLEPGPGMGRRGPGNTAGKTASASECEHVWFLRLV